MASHPSLSVLEAADVHTMLSRIQAHDWAGAHEIAQSQEGVWAYDRLHAYLHRLEGDVGNAAYWYRRCGVSLTSASEKEEFQFLTQWVNPYHLTEEVLFFVLTQAEWSQQKAEEFITADSLTSEGFIHLCTESQLAGVLDRYFSGLTDLCILHLNTQDLQNDLKMEKGPTGDFFPHLFAQIPRRAILKVQE